MEMSVDSDPSSSTNVPFFKYCKKFLERSFTNSFLDEIGIGDPSQFRSSIAHRVATLVPSRERGKCHSSQEVSLVGRSSNPSVSKKGIPFSLCCLNELSWKPQHSISASDDLFWEYSYNEGENSRLLVSYICFKNATHQLTLRDATDSVICLFSEPSSVENLVSLHGKVVVVWKHRLIHEKFQWMKNDEEKVVVWEYVPLMIDSISIVSPPNDTEYGKNSTQSLNCCGASDRQIIIPKTSPLKQFRSQLIFVQHKPALSVPGNSQPPRCTILVSLLGKTVLWNETPVTSNTNTPTPIFICLKGSLLALYHFIAVNHIYEIRLPVSCDIHFFAKKSPFWHLESIAKFLPTIDGVTLPDSAEILFVKSPIASSIQQVDCYSVNDAVNHASCEEFISVIGYISSRIHSVPRFEREQLSVNIYGFGIPDTRVIQLFISSQPPGSPSTTSYAVFLSNWNLLKYPLTLIPGTKVIIRFVKKIIPKSTNAHAAVYFRTSILSSVECIELPLLSATEIERRVQWGPRHLINEILDSDIVGWISVSMMTLINFHFEAQCEFCSHTFQGNSCSYVGCLAEGNPKIFSQASVFTSEFGVGTVIIFIPSKHVKKFLNISDAMWMYLRQIAKYYGKLTYLKGNSKQDPNKMRIEERVFHLYSSLLLHGRRVHMLCRKFRAQPSFENAVPKLYCVDLAEVELFRSCVS